MFLNNSLHIKANWIGHILRRNCLLHDAIEGQMVEVKGARRRTKLLGDLKDRKRYWKLMEEAEDEKGRELQFIRRT